MKLLGISVVMFVFVGMPLYVLNTLVLPELNQLQNTYAHASDTADKLVGANRQSQ